MSTPQIHLDPRVQQVAQQAALGTPTGAFDVTNTQKAKTERLTGMIAIGVGVIAVLVWIFAGDHLSGRMGAIVAITTLAIPLGIIVLVGAWWRASKGNEHLVWCPNGLIWFVDKSGTNTVFPFSAMRATVKRDETNVAPKPGELAQPWTMTLTGAAATKEFAVDTEQKKWAANQVLERLGVTPIA